MLRDLDTATDAVLSLYGHDPDEASPLTRAGAELTADFMHHVLGMVKAFANAKTPKK